MMLFDRKPPRHVQLRRQVVGAGCQLAGLVTRNASGGTLIGFAFGAHEYTMKLAKRQRLAAQQQRFLPTFSWAELVIEASDCASVGAVVGLAVSAANGLICWLTD